MALEDSQVYLALTGCKGSGVYLGGLVFLACKVIKEKRVIKEIKDDQKLETQVSQDHQVRWVRQEWENQDRQGSRGHRVTAERRGREDTPGSPASQECAIPTCATLQW